MVISDLNYLQSAALSSVKGGIFNFFTVQSNFSAIGQSSSAAAGNVAGLSVLNLAASVNTANVVQTNA